MKNRGRKRDKRKRRKKRNPDIEAFDKAAAIVRMNKTRQRKKAPK